MSLPGLSSAAVTVLSAPGSTASAVLHDATVDSIWPRAAAAAFRLASDGKAYRGINGAYSVIETWLFSGASSAFAAFVSVNSGSLASGTAGSEVSLSSDQTWSVVASTSGAAASANLTVEIRDAATHTPLTSAIIDLNAEWL